jgi:hypothetical protein
MKTTDSPTPKRRYAAISTKSTVRELHRKNGMIHIPIIQHLDGIIAPSIENSNKMLEDGFPDAKLKLME